MHGNRHVLGAKTPFGGAIPGTFQYYHTGQATFTGSFSSGGSYTETVSEGSLQKAVKKGERVIDYGCNLYKMAGGTTDISGGIGSAASLSTSSTSATTSDPLAASNGGEELNLLANLLRQTPIADKGAKSTGGTLMLSLFESEADEARFVKEVKEANIVKIDASQRDTKHIAKMVGDGLQAKPKKSAGATGKKSKGDELLALMDEAADSEPK